MKFRVYFGALQITSDPMTAVEAIEAIKRHVEADGFPYASILYDGGPAFGVLMIDRADGRMRFTSEPPADVRHACADLGLEFRTPTAR